MTDDELQAYYDAVEIQDFKNKPAFSWMFYIDLEKRVATTYRGQTLGRLIIDGIDTINTTKEYRLVVLGVNGINYAGGYRPNPYRCCQLCAIELIAHDNITPLRPRHIKEKSLCEYQH